METDLLELAVERFIAAPPEKVWEVWTTRLPEWWAPKPWTTTVIAMDLRPGGRSAMTMRGPDGETPPMEGVFLEVAPQRRIVVTDAYREGWIPQPPFMTAVFEFTPEGEGTRYRASTRHWTDDACKQHETMGFIEGWGKVADQLAALAEG